VYAFSRDIMPPFATHAKVSKKDIDEGGIDEEAHGVAPADTHVLP